MLAVKEDQEGKPSPRSIGVEELEVDDRSAQGVARAVGKMITAGRFSPGSRLPTVRTLADHLGVSPATISEAWQVLRGAGLIHTRGRNGTTVAAVPQRREAGRYGRVAGIGSGLDHNLATGTPDPDLLPRLAPLISSIDFSTAVVDYLAPPVIPELEELLEERWPFPAESLTITNGTMDALARTADELVSFGSPVAVEDPTFPPLIDALEQRGALLLPIELDEEGPRADQLRAALQQEPVAFFVQPRAHNPTGVDMSEGRAEELAEIVERSNTIIVENDHAGEIAESPPVSLGRWLPGRTVRILGFSKSHGPDLRLAAMAGRGDVIDAVAARRVVGPGWSSRLLQRILYGLLTDPRSQGTVQAARDTYARRRTALVNALGDAGIEVRCDDGINLWLPVADEGYALVTLAAHGIAAAPGSPFCISHRPSDHIRITVGLVPEDEAGDLAAVLQVAARSGVPLRFG